MQNRQSSSTFPSQNSYLRPSSYASTIQVQNIQQQYQILKDKVQGKIKELQNQCVENCDRESFGNAGMRDTADINRNQQNDRVGYNRKRNYDNYNQNHQHCHHNDHYQPSPPQNPNQPYLQKPLHQIPYKPHQSSSNFAYDSHYSYSDPYLDNQSSHHPRFYHSPSISSQNSGTGGTGAYVLPQKVCQRVESKLNNNNGNIGYYHQMTNNTPQINNTKQMQNRPSGIESIQTNMLHSRQQYCQPSSTNYINSNTNYNNNSNLGVGIYSKNNGNQNNSGQPYQQSSNIHIRDNFQEKKEYANNFVNNRNNNDTNLDKYANNSTRKELLMQNIKQQQQLTNNFKVLTSKLQHYGRDKLQSPNPNQIKDTKNDDRRRQRTETSRQQLQTRNSKKKCNQPHQPNQYNEYSNTPYHHYPSTCKKCSQLFPIIHNQHCQYIQPQYIKYHEGGRKTNKNLRNCYQYGGCSCSCQQGYQHTSRKDHQYRDQPHDQHQPHNPRKPANNPCTTYDQDFQKYPTTINQRLIQNPKIAHKLKTTTQHFYPQNHQLIKQKNQLLYSDSFARAKSVSLHSQQFKPLQKYNNKPEDHVMENTSKCECQSRNYSTKKKQNSQYFSHQHQNNQCHNCCHHHHHPQTYHHHHHHQQHQHGNNYNQLCTSRCMHPQNPLLPDPSPLPQTNQVLQMYEQRSRKKHQQIYRDSQHRNQKHEKQHVMQSFQQQQKSRKQLIDKISKNFQHHYQHNKPQS